MQLGKKHSSYLKHGAQDQHQTFWPCTQLQIYMQIKKTSDLTVSVKYSMVVHHLCFGVLILAKGDREFS